MIAAWPTYERCADSLILRNVKKQLFLHLRTVGGIADIGTIKTKNESEAKEHMGQPERSKNDKYEHPTFSAEEFLKEDYIRLWEYFENRADMLKDRLWTIGTWLLGFNSALLAFIFGTELITFDAVGLVMHSPSVVLVLALAGCALCLYAWLLIEDYGDHIWRNWQRANLLQEKLPLVNDVLEKTKEKKAQRKQSGDLPPIARSLHRFTLGYLGLFLFIAVLALVILLANMVTT